MTGHEAAFFGIDWHDFFKAFVMFAAAYFGTKHGSSNGNSTK
jgi:hypothetical protein